MTVRTKISGLILLLMFIGQMAGASLFPHWHLVDGQVIAHSHPYSGTPASPNHEHSRTQLVVIAMMSVALLAASAILVPARPAGCATGLFVVLREPFAQRCGNPLDRLRGPPAC